MCPCGRLQANEKFLRLAQVQFGQSTSKAPMSRRRLPPLNALRAFEAAARHLSFEKAGDEIAVTASAVGQQVKALEAWLGRRLFVRQPSRGVVLTPLGEHY